MGVLTINSAELVNPPDFDPLLIDFRLTANANNLSQIFRITDGTANVSNQFNFNLPPGITIIQPAAFNIVNFNPDNFRIDSFQFIPSIGSTGFGELFEEDGSTLVTLPVTIPTNFSSPTPQYIASIKGFTSNNAGEDTLAGLMTIGISFIDTIANITVSKTITVRILNFS